MRSNPFRNRLVWLVALLAVPMLVVALVYVAGRPTPSGRGAVDEHEQAASKTLFAATFGRSILRATIGGD